MSSLPVVEQRLEALELKAIEAEDLLEQLNMALYRQARQIEQLQAQLQQLRLQVRDNAGTAAQRDARGEIPPHY